MVIAPKSSLVLDLIFYCWRSSMNLSQALSILSKSSPYAVSTERDEEHDILASYKEYIYIKTDIETDFAKALTSAKSNEIIFLCGSSGDGKSEILTRYSQKYKATHDFHLDATHSFSPNQTAIQALDERFSEFKASEKPLVIGINVGMMGNYAQDGAEKHSDIKQSIAAFLENRKANVPESHIYLDFEHYPKFTLDYEENTSKFASQLISRLTEESLDNPFYALYDSEVKKTGHSSLTANFALLSLKSVQSTLISLLLKVRLVNEQFLTARTFLDFVFQLLAMDGYLFDNLFEGKDNELLEHLYRFDPSNIHTRKIDEFVLQFGLGIEDEGFTQLKEQVKQLGVFEVSNAASYLRMVYLLKDEEQFANQYINELKVDFDNDLVSQYANIWLLHRKFDGSREQRKSLSKFYTDTFTSAIHRYCNRNSPSLDKDQFFISEYNGFKTAVELEVEADFSAIKKSGVSKIGSFNAYISIDGSPLLPIPVSINFLDLLRKINLGYRPNKHDKNAVLLLDEVIEKIISIANQKNTLFIIRDEDFYKVVNKHDAWCLR